MAGLMASLFFRGGLESLIVLNDSSAARWRARLVHCSSTEVRLGEEEHARDSQRRGRVVERRAWYCFYPSWSQHTRTLVLVTLGATTAWGGGVYGTVWQRIEDTIRL